MKYNANHPNFQTIANIASGIEASLYNNVLRTATFSSEELRDRDEEILICWSILLKEDENE